MLNGNFMCTLLWEERNGRFLGFAAQGQAAALTWWGGGQDVQMPAGNKDLPADTHLAPGG